MAISGKPQKNAPAKEVEAKPNEQEVFNLIHKGGSVAKAAAAKPVRDAEKPMLVQLRLHPELVEEIDAVRNAHRNRRHRASSRHAWIIDAIEEKIARDKSSS